MFSGLAEYIRPAISMWEVITLPSQNAYLEYTGCGHRMAHRKWKKLSNSKACCLAQLCLAAAKFFLFPIGHPEHEHFTVHSSLYMEVAERLR